MKEIINESEIKVLARQSRTGKYGLSRKDISGALETSGQPFEVEWMRLPPGKTNFPCHAHQVQWEFYIVLRGQGTVRRNDHTFEVGAGDAFVSAARHRASDTQYECDRRSDLVCHCRQSRK